jgi:hypothetical protein
VTVKNKSKFMTSKGLKALVVVVENVYNLVRVPRGTFFFSVFKACLLVAL